MPTVNDLISQIADESGLDATLDQSAIVRALNRAQRSICSRVPMLTVTTNSTTAGDGTTDFFSTGSSIERIHAVLLCANGNHATGPFTELVQGNPGDIALGKQTTPPTHYWMYGSSQFRTNGPVPVGQSLVVHYDPVPAALVAGGTEASISIPIAFHEDALAQVALTYILEGYEGDEQRAAYFRGLSSEAFERLKRWAFERGGVEAPNARFGAQHFHTPDPLRVR